MAYDEDLAERIRFALSAEDVREVPMFGGLSFMIDEKIAVSANAHGDLMVRCDPARVVELLDRPGAEPAEMGNGRRMSAGWIRVTDDGIRDDGDFEFWIESALEFNRASRSGR